MVPIQNQIQSSPKEKILWWVVLQDHIGNERCKVAQGKHRIRGQGLTTFPSPHCQRVVARWEVLINNVTPWKHGGNSWVDSRVITLILYASQIFFKLFSHLFGSSGSWQKTVSPSTCMTPPVWHPAGPTTGIVNLANSRTITLDQTSSTSNQSLKSIFLTLLSSGSRNENLEFKVWSTIYPPHMPAQCWVPNEAGRMEGFNAIR